MGCTGIYVYDVCNYNICLCLKLGHSGYYGRYSNKYTRCYVHVSYVDMFYIRRCVLDMCLVREGGNGMKGERGCPAIHSGVARLGLTKLQKVKFIKGHKLFNSDTL